MENLLERINRVINTEAFDRTLKKYYISLFDFQINWPDYETFENLPAEYKEAILEGEKELKNEISN